MLTFDELSRTNEVFRSDGIERFFPLISLLSSDEVLSFDYVFKCCGFIKS